MLYGRQVALRALEPGDLDFLAQLTNHPEVRAQVVGWDFPVSRDAQLAWFRRPDPSTRRLAVESLSTGGTTVDARTGVGVSGRGMCCVRG